MSDRDPDEQRRAPTRRESERHRIPPREEQPKPPRKGGVGAPRVSKKRRSSSDGTPRKPTKRPRIVFEPPRRLSPLEQLESELTTWHNDDLLALRRSLRRNGKSDMAAHCFSVAQSFSRRRASGTPEQQHLSRRAHQDGDLDSQNPLKDEKHSKKSTRRWLLEGDRIQRLLSLAPSSPAPKNVVQISRLVALFDECLSESQRDPSDSEDLSEDSESSVSRTLDESSYTSDFDSEASGFGHESEDLEIVGGELDPLESDADTREKEQEVIRPQVAKKKIKSLQRFDPDWLHMSLEFLPPKTDVEHVIHPRVVEDAAGFLRQMLSRVISEVAITATDRSNVTSSDVIPALLEDDVCRASLSRVNALRDVLSDAKREGRSPSNDARSEAQTSHPPTNAESHITQGQDHRQDGLETRAPKALDVFELLGERDALEAARERYGQGSQATRAEKLAHTQRCARDVLFKLFRNHGNSGTVESVSDWISDELTNDETKALARRLGVEVKPPSLKTIAMRLRHASDFQLSPQHSHTHGIWYLKDYIHSRREPLSRS